MFNRKIYLQKVLKMVQNGRPILLLILILVHISAPNRIRNRKQFESRDKIKLESGRETFDSSNNFETCMKRNGTKITNNICIGNNYDKFSVPLDTKDISAPLTVQAKIIVFGLKDVNLVANTYSLYKTLYEEWTDPKIKG